MYWQSTDHFRSIWKNGQWLMSGLLIGWICSSCIGNSSSSSASTITAEVSPTSPIDSLVLLFQKNPGFYSTGFDFPVGKPNAKGYYNAQAFGENDHLGDDWNGTGGGNTDLGDPIYSISEGYVTESVNFYGGWGNVTRVAHAIDGQWSIENGQLVKDTSRQAEPYILESLYAHSQKVLVKQGDFVERGQQIATIGNAEGVYLAHLHLEIRERARMELGGGYSGDRNGYLDPTEFIKANRRR